MPSPFNQELDYYLVQTENTDPTQCLSLYENISDKVSDIFYCSRNVIEHYNGINADKIDKSRYKEMEIDRVSDILSRIYAQGIRDISLEIPLEKKIIGNCFNIAKLAVSLLRSKRIPARLRYAYCTYFNHKNNPNVNSEQVLVEYWDFAQSRWMRGDPSMNDEILDHLSIKVEMNFLDVCKTLSQPISEVWLNCRAGIWRFEDYGVSLGASRHRCGQGHVALKLTQDIACLNQLELFAFDFISSPKRFRQEINLRTGDFDKLAHILQQGDFQQCLFSNPQIPFSTQPRRVLRKSPLSGVTCKKGTATRV